MDLIVILLGVLANLFFITSGIFKDPQNSIRFCIIGNLIYIFYYLILGLTGPLINIAIGTLTGLLILKLSCPTHIKKVAITSATLISLLIIRNLSATIEIYILVAAWCICFAQMHKHNYVLYKYAILMSQSLWIVYCLNVDDYAMLTTCLFIITTNSSSLLYNKVLKRHPIQTV